MIYKLRLKAIFVGLLVNLVGGFFLGLAVLFCVTVYLGTQDWSPEQVTRWFYTSTSMMLLSLGITGFMAVLGGWITAKMAKEHQLFNVFCFAVIVLLIDFALTMTPFYPLWFKCVLYMFGLVLPFIGGFLAGVPIKREAK